MYIQQKKERKHGNYGIVCLTYRKIQGHSITELSVLRERKHY
jgi:hypothetical protein